jgi:hypothetical protein
MMNWKEDFKKEFITYYTPDSKDHLVEAYTEEIFDFISKEIIEKLIADIPSQVLLPDWSDLTMHEVDASKIEQQLKDKWL